MRGVQPGVATASASARSVHTKAERSPTLIFTPRDEETDVANVQDLKDDPEESPDHTPTADAAITPTAVADELDEAKAKEELGSDHTDEAEDDSPFLK